MKSLLYTKISPINQLRTFNAKQLIVKFEMNNKHLYYIIAFFVCESQCLRPSVRNETVDESGSCDEGWFDASFVDLGCILFSSERRYYYEANTFCQDLGSHLIEIHSHSQLDFIKMELQLLDEDFSGEIYWWSSGSDSGREGQWYWEHSLTPVQDFVWDAGYPRDLTRNNYLCFDNEHDHLAIDCEITIHANCICQI